MKISIALSLLLALYGLSAGALRADDAATPISPGTALPIRRAKHVRRAIPHAANSRPRDIAGSCSIIADAGNPFGGPCVDLVLLLRDASGNELMRTRTSNRGQFVFAPDAGLVTDAAREYRIASGSRLYENVLPGAPVHLGERIGLRLQQK